MQIVQSSPGFRFYFSGFFFFNGGKPPNCHFYGTWQDRPHGGAPWLIHLPGQATASKEEHLTIPFWAMQGAPAANSQGTGAVKTPMAGKIERISPNIQKYPKMSQLSRYIQLSQICQNSNSAQPVITSIAQGIQRTGPHHFQLHTRGVPRRNNRDLFLVAPWKMVIEDDLTDFAMRNREFTSCPWSGFPWWNWPGVPVL